MKPAILAIAAASLGVSASYGQTILSVGDIKITSYNSDAPDGFTFVLLRDVAANTALKITDGGFNTSVVSAANAFRSTENGLYFTFTGAATAGTVVRVTDNSGTPSFTASSGYTSGFSGTVGGLTGISGSGDQLLIYQGAGAPTATMTTNASGWNIGAFNNSATTFSGTLVEGLTFRGSASTTSWLTTGSATSNTSYLPSTLNVQDANIAIGTANSLHGRYNGSISGLTSGQYAAAISSVTNWVTANANTVLSTTGFSVSSTSAVNWDANGATAGNGGAGTWDSTTSDRFKNGDSGTTYMRWVNSTTGNDHTAVFGGTAGAVSIAGGGVTASGLQFDSDGYTIQSNTLTFAGSTPVISVTTAAHSATISATLAGSTGLIKSGAGTLNITGANSTNIGATTVTAGTLNVGVGGSGTLNSAVTVNNSGSTLGGSGTITGNVAINDGAILAPGNSPGIMTVAGTTTLSTGSIFSWELNNNLDGDAGDGDTGTRGTNYDGLTSNSLAVASGAIFRVVLTDTASLTNAFWNQNQTWTNIFSVSGSTTNAAPNQLFNTFQVFNGATNVTPASASEGTFSFNGSTLTWTAVPEPSSALAGLLIAAGLLRRRRVA